MKLKIIFHKKDIAGYLTMQKSMTTPEFQKMLRFVAAPKSLIVQKCLAMQKSPTIELWLHLVITTNERECKLNVLWVSYKFSLSFTSVHSRFFHNCSKIAVNQIHCSKRPNTIFQQL